jgi:hypothetical protein
MRPVLPAIVLACLAFFPVTLRAVPPKAEPGPPTPAELAAGRELAERLRSSAPSESSEYHGRLIIKNNGVTRQVPVMCRIIINPTNWEAVYETSATNDEGAERLVVIHETNGPNQYLYARAASPSEALPKVAPVTPADAAIPLAGSDFSLADLGLDFLHWPVQRRMKGEMRLGQPCYVLESSNPTGSNMVRVKSDIDEDSGGILIADGYDSQGHMVKAFSLHNSSFKKVNGQWHVEKMDIINKKTGSHTELKFDLN